MPMLTLPDVRPPQMVSTPAKPTVEPSKLRPLINTWLSCVATADDCSAVETHVLKRSSREEESTSPLLIL